MPENVTFFLNLSSRPSAAAQPVSLTNLNSGQSWEFNSLDSALRYLDETHPTQQPPHKAPTSASGNGQQRP